MDALSVLIAIAGLYMIIAALRLKISGNITPSLMLSRKSRASDIKDMDGFRKYMFPRVLGFGIYTVAFAFVDIIIGTTVIAAVCRIVFTLVFLGLCYIYVKWIFRATELFLN